MIIDQLPALATAGDNDEIAIEVGTTTYKIKKSDFLKEFMPKSGGEFTGNVTVGGVLDVATRRCYATLSSAGWFRVMDYHGTDSGAVNGGTGLVVDFNIQRATRAENHSITLRCASSGSIFFENEHSNSYVVYIDKIRYTYNSTTLHGYVDIHYAGSDLSQTGIGVDFVAHTSYLHVQGDIASVGLTSVADSPSGETIVTEYAFAKSTITPAEHFRSTPFSSGGTINISVSRVYDKPLYGRPFGFFVYGYEGVSFFHGTGYGTSLSFSQAGVIGSAPVTQSGTTLTAVSSNRTLICLGDDSLTFTTI